MKASIAQSAERSRISIPPIAGMVEQLLKVEPYFAKIRLAILAYGQGEEDQP
jgi:hypothetical protein